MMRATGALALSAVLALSAAACGDSDSGGSGDGELKIGFIGDLTGENSAIVIPPRNGAQLAIDEYNATNPKNKIKLVPYDSRAEPATAVNLAQNAVKKDKVVGIIGPAFSGESKQAVPVLEEAGIPSISPSATNADLAKNGWKFWHRDVANDAAQGPAAASFVARAAAPKRLFLVDDKSEYGKGLGDQVKAAVKGAQVETDSIDPQASDYSAVVNKAVQFKPDFVFFGGYYAQAGKLLKQLRDKGITAKFMSGDGSLHSKLIEGAGKPAAEGALVSCPCRLAYAIKEPKLTKFSDDFKAKFGGALPEIYATEGYDAASAFINVIKAGNTTPAKINDALKNTNFDGMSKHVQFTPEGEATVKDVFIYQVKNGAIELLGNSNEAKLG